MRANSGLNSPMRWPSSGVVQVGPGERGHLRKRAASAAMRGRMGLQVDGDQHAEQVDALAAHRLHVVAPRRILGERPRRVPGDVLVGLVGERRDLAHRARRVAASKWAAMPSAGVDEAAPTAPVVQLVGERGRRTAW
jgi:hypothetical protein